MIFVLYLFTSQLYTPCHRVDLLRFKESTMEQHSRNQEIKNWRAFKIEQPIDCKTKESRLERRVASQKRKAFHCIALHCITRHCIALHDIALHYTTLHCITRHCIALHYPFLSSHEFLLGRHKLSWVELHTKSSVYLKHTFYLFPLMSLHPREFSVHEPWLLPCNYLRKKTLNANNSRCFTFRNSEHKDEQERFPHHTIIRSYD